MSNSENWIVGSALLGLSLVLGAAATAMEPDKKAASAQSSASRPLPAFFDGARLPSLQDVWKQGDVGESTAVPQPSNTAPSHERFVNESKTPLAANAAGRPTEGARPVTTVRQRAEELSQRFGGGAKAMSPAEGEASEITTGALPDDSAWTPTTAQGEQAATVAAEPANERKPAAGVKAETTPPSPTIKQAAIPPTPVRAPRTAQFRKPLLPPKSRVGAVPRLKPLAAPAARRGSPPVTIPTQLQSLGWDSRDQLQ